MTAELKTATFAGGCFWCMVQPFDTYPGIERVVSGYTGGHVANPTYEQVCAGGTGHTEAVQITYNPSKVSYADLVEIYWQQTDPTDAFGQFQDRGDNYRPIEPAQPFYPAEEYHQDFYKKDPFRMMIEEAGGRQKFIDQHWKGVSGK